MFFEIGWGKNAHPRCYKFLINSEMHFGDMKTFLKFVIYGRYSHI